jgi:hypothetical protein
MESDDTKIITRLKDAGLSAEMIEQTLDTSIMWRQSLRKIKTNNQSQEASPTDTLNRLFSRFAP